MWQGKCSKYRVVRSKEIPRPIKEDRGTRMWQGKCSKYRVVRSKEIPRPIRRIEVPGCAKVSVVNTEL